MTMEKSTKEQFYEFIENILDEVNIPPPSGKQTIVTPQGNLKDKFEVLHEYDENMQLRIVLTIVSCLTKEGKLQDLYWLLRNKYLENLD